MLHELGKIDANALIVVIECVVDSVCDRYLLSYVVKLYFFFLAIQNISIGSCLFSDNILAKIKRLCCCIAVLVCDNISNYLAVGSSECTVSCIDVLGCNYLKLRTAETTFLENRSICGWLHSEKYRRALKRISCLSEHYQS